MPPVQSKIKFVGYTPPYTPPRPRLMGYQSERDFIRGDLRKEISGGLGIVGIQMPYTPIEYGMLIWWHGWLLDGWPSWIPFTNLSDIKGGIATLRILRDLWRKGKLKFIPAPREVRDRAMHNPESILPHVMSAATLPPVPRALPPLPSFDLSQFQDLLSPPNRNVSIKTRMKPMPASVFVPPVPAAKEVVLRADNLEPILSQSLDPDVPRQPHGRRQRSDIKTTRSTTTKTSHSHKVGPLTSHYVLDSKRGGPSIQPAVDTVMKPLSEWNPFPLMVDESIGDYVAEDSVEDEIESDVESASGFDA